LPEVKSHACRAPRTFLDSLELAREKSLNEDVFLSSRADYLSGPVQANTYQESELRQAIALSLPQFFAGGVWRVRLRIGMQGFLKSRNSSISWSLLSRRTNISTLIPMLARMLVSADDPISALDHIDALLVRCGALRTRPLRLASGQCRAEILTAHIE
jgi:hypothetical protein